MVNMQKEIIKKFQATAGERTFSEYADISGIERTRIFRLFNGAEMKLSEYEKLNEYIATKSKAVDPNFLESMGEISGSNLKSNFELAMKRKLELSRLLNCA